MANYSSFISQIENRCLGAWSEINRINGLRDELLSQKSEAIMAISDAESYLDYKDEVASVLSRLHEDSVEKTKALYEDLLTGLIRDIFPDDPENHSVSFNLSVKRSQTALNIQVINRHGYPRDVFMDKGGSVRTVIAIGLRFIAIAKSPRRRVAILDEIDHELNPDYVPRFAQMMSELSRKIGIQLIYISHHDYRIFEGVARIIRLTREDGVLYSDCISDQSPLEIEGWEGDSEAGDWMDGVGLRDVRLVNVKQHRDTLIELSPLVNVITGGNDIGKTTVIQAIQCVVRNGGRDALINDFARDLSIEIGLEDGYRVVYSYKKSGNKKTSYRLYDHQQNKIKESNDGVRVPDWLNSFMGMDLYCGLDLHIGTHFNKNFILDHNISENKRADILSMNNTNGDAQSLISLHNKKVDEKRKLYNFYKKRLSSVKKRLEIASSIEYVEPDLKAAFDQINSLKYLNSEVDEIMSLGQSVSILCHTLRHLSVIDETPVPIKEDVDFIGSCEFDLRDIQCLVVDFDFLSGRSKELGKISNITLSSFDLDIEPIDDLFNLGVDMASLIKKREEIERIESLSLPDLSNLEKTSEGDESDCELIVNELVTLNEKSSSYENILRKKSEEAQKMDIEIKETLGDLGYCPVCNQTVSKDGDHKE